MSTDASADMIMDYIMCENKRWCVNELPLLGSVWVTAGEYALSFEKGLMTGECRPWLVYCFVL